jgi:hypothetical protein
MSSLDSVWGSRFDSTFAHFLVIPIGDEQEMMSGSRINESHVNLKSIPTPGHNSYGLHSVNISNFSLKINYYKLLR